MAMSHNITSLKVLFIGVLSFIDHYIASTETLCSIPLITTESWFSTKIHFANHINLNWSLYRTTSRLHANLSWHIFVKTSPQALKLSVQSHLWVIHWTSATRTINQKRTGETRRYQNRRQTGFGWRLVLLTFSSYCIIRSSNTFMAMSSAQYIETIVIANIFCV